MAQLKIINIMLASVDGKIAFHSQESTAEREQKKFTCTADFERMRSLVSQCSTVFIGAKSLEVEKGAFRVADLTQTGLEPEWIVFTQSNKVNLEHPFWQQNGIPKALFHMASASIHDAPVLKIERIGKMIKYTGNLAGLFNLISKRNSATSCDSLATHTVALLGGGKLNAIFWEQGLVQELYLTLSPHMMGNSIQARAIVDSQKHINGTLELLKVSHSKNFVFLDYKTI